MDREITYDKPREKLQKKGIAALTNAELLQVLIGSGNAQMSVVKIARKTLKVLSKYGSDISLDQLSTIPGFGIARSSVILASFELASRYPMVRRQLTINTEDKQRALFMELSQSRQVSLVYTTLDGGKGLIAKRMAVIDSASHPSLLLRDIFSHVVTDNAAGILVAIGSSDHTLEPSLFELSLARDINSMAQLFIVTVHAIVLVNSGGDKSLRSEIW